MGNRIYVKLVVILVLVILSQETVSKSVRWGILRNHQKNFVQNFASHIMLMSQIKLVFHNALKMQT